MNLFIYCLYEEKNEKIKFSTRSEKMASLEFQKTLCKGYLGDLRLCKYSDDPITYVSKCLPRSYCDLILKDVYNPNILH